jgi:hypothetical protein
MALTRRPFRQAALISTLAGAAFSLVGVFGALGMPGALLALAAVEIAGLAVDNGRRPFPQDSAWPFFIYVTLLWGLAVPVAWLGTRRWQGWRRALAFLSGFALLGVAVATALYLVMIAPML